jgi:hypothetical protein
MREILKTCVNPTHNQLKVVESYMTYLAPQEREKPTVYWIYGPSGMGKSKYAHKNFEDKFWKDKSKWWNGCDNHKTIILDDLRGSDIKFNELLTILDRYPKYIETKGGGRWLNSNNTVITTQYRPYDMYHKEEEEISQLIRRIDHVIHMADCS